HREPVVPEDDVVLVPHGDKTLQGKDAFDADIVNEGFEGRRSTPPIALSGRATRSSAPAALIQSRTLALPGARGVLGLWEQRRRQIGAQPRSTRVPAHTGARRGSRSQATAGW